MRRTRFGRTTRPRKVGVASNARPQATTHGSRRSAWRATRAKALAAPVRFALPSPSGVVPSSRRRRRELPSWRPLAMSAAVLSPVRHIIHAVATTVVPETASFEAHAWAELDGAIEGTVAQRDEGVRRQLVTFLRLLQMLPIARYGRTFTALSARRRHAVLETLERSPSLAVRRGFWGIRTLIFMAYYTRPDVVDRLGYRAIARGWAGRAELAGSEAHTARVAAER